MVSIATQAIIVRSTSYGNSMVAGQLKTGHLSIQMSYWPWALNFVQFSSNDSYGSVLVGRPLPKSFKIKFALPATIPTVNPCHWPVRLYGYPGVSPHIEHLSKWTVLSGREYKNQQSSYVFSSTLTEQCNRSTQILACNFTLQAPKAPSIMAMTVPLIITSPSSLNIVSPRMNSNSSRMSTGYTGSWPEGSGSYPYTGSAQTTVSTPW